jgi:succinate dehydrogenase / fumarate reductase iron-sulfur subunit
MAANTLEVNMYRYNPEEDKFPYIKQYKIEKPTKDIMVLDLLHLLKEKDESISYRRSCREGVCGSDGMNINGKNGLACITPLSSVKTAAWIACDSRLSCRYDRVLCAIRKN